MEEIKEDHSKGIVKKLIVLKIVNHFSTGEESKELKNKLKNPKRSKRLMKS